MALSVHAFFARSKTSNNTTPETVGQMYWNESEHAGYASVLFRVVASISNAAATGEVELYNLTDDVSVTTITYNGAAHTDYTKQDASVSLSDGKIYEIRISVDSGVYNINLGSAGFVIKDS